MLSLVTFTLALLFAFAAAQSSTITWLEPGPTGGDFAYAGSVVDACPDTTVVALQCTSAGSDAFADLCGTDAPAMTMTVGPSQVHFHGNTETTGLAFEMDLSCDINESSATCTDSTSWSAVATSTDVAESSTYAVSAMATHTAAITAGAGKLDNKGKCKKSTTSNGKGRDNDESAGGKLAVSMGFLGLTSFVGMLFL